MGTPIAGRGRTEMEGLIGFFVNTLVLRTDSRAIRIHRVARSRAGDRVGRLHASGPALREARRGISPSRDMSRNPLFQVMINYVDGSESSRSNLPGLVARQIPQSSVSAKFAMTLVYPRAQAQRWTGAGLPERIVLVGPDREHARTVCLSARADRNRAGEIHREYSLVTASSSARLPDPTIAIETRPQQSVVAQVLTWAQSAPERIAVEHRRQALDLCRADRPRRCRFQRRCRKWVSSEATSWRSSGRAASASSEQCWAFS